MGKLFAECVVVELLLAQGHAVVQVLARLQAQAALLHQVVAWFVPITLGRSFATNIHRLVTWVVMEQCAQNVMLKGNATPIAVQPLVQVHVVEIRLHK